MGTVNENAIGVRRAEARKRHLAKYRASAKFKAKQRAERDQKRAYMLAYRVGYKYRAMAGYSPDGVPRCACCGVTNVVFLTIDHVNGDGHYERKTGTSGCSLGLHMRVVKEGWPDRFQVLCFNCNMAKHIMGECPHRGVQ